ncbi:MAG: hypothetical protein O3A51_00155 [Verrucomicrobia bacterium]|nr:hypothetical protein [Verrucomicrobiota bacterium]
MIEHPLWTSVPAAILFAGGLFEVARGIGRHRSWGREQVWRLAVWALRPWTCWAIFNIIFRLNWDRGFNNRRTFPFFANLWDRRAGFWEHLGGVLSRPGIWGWAIVVALLIAALTVMACRIVRRPESSSSRLPLPTLLLIYGLAVALHLSVACLPRGAGLGNDDKGSLLSSWHAHATMLYAVPQIKSTDHYLRHFEDLQPQLRHTIHGLSHPPGASLSIYWIGCVTGARGMDIRLNSTRIRYALGLTLFSGLNVFILYGLGSRLFRSTRSGLLASLLWAVAPSVMAYNTHAQDGVYAVCYNLALLLGWIVITQSPFPRWRAIVLGVLFWWLTLLNYSWGMMTTIFAVFGLVTGWRSGWRLQDYALRLVLPLGVLAVLFAATLLGFKLNYWAIYTYARDYVDEWYEFNSLYQHLTAWIGGQLDIWLMMGSVTLAAFITRWRAHEILPARPGAGSLLLVVLAIFALPILFGPTCLRMETARCWNWVTAVPLAYAARCLMAQPAPVLFSAGAVLISSLTYVAMRLFMNFAP